MPTHTGLTQNAQQRLHTAIATLLQDFIPSHAEEVAEPHLEEIKSLKLELSARHDAHMAEKNKLQDTLQSVRDANEGLRSELATLRAENAGLRREIGVKDSEVTELEKVLSDTRNALTEKMRDTVGAPSLAKPDAAQS